MRTGKLVSSSVPPADEGAIDGDLLVQQPTCVVPIVTVICKFVERTGGARAQGVRNRYVNCRTYCSRRRDRGDRSIAHHRE